MGLTDSGPHTHFDGGNGLYRWSMQLYILKTEFRCWEFFLVDSLYLNDLDMRRPSFGYQNFRRSNLAVLYASRGMYLFYYAYWNF